MKPRQIAQISSLAAILLLTGCDNQQQATQSNSSASRSDPAATEPEYRPVGQGTTAGDWDAYGAEIGSTKYTPLDQINADNINN